jgi:hypothetical protein
MKNLETKKMNVAKIIGKLSFSNMENIMGGQSTKTAYVEDSSEYRCVAAHQVMFATFVGGLLFGSVGGYIYGSFVYSAQKNGKGCI